jgi:hypothetical protein
LGTVRLSLDFSARQPLVRPIFSMNLREMLEKVCLHVIRFF